MHWFAQLSLLAVLSNEHRAEEPPASPLPLQGRCCFSQTNCLQKLTEAALTGPFGEKAFEKPRRSKKELQWVIKYLLIWNDTQFSIQEQYPVLSFKRDVKVRFWLHVHRKSYGGFCNEQNHCQALGVKKYQRLKISQNCSENQSVFQKHKLNLCLFTFSYLFSALGFHTFRLFLA